MCMSSCTNTSDSSASSTHDSRFVHITIERGSGPATKARAPPSAPSSLQGRHSILIESVICGCCCASGDVAMARTGFWWQTGVWFVLSTKIDGSGGRKCDHVRLEFIFSHICCLGRVTMTPSCSNKSCFVEAPRTFNKCSGRESEDTKTFWSIRTHFWHWSKEEVFSSLLLYCGVDDEPLLLQGTSTRTFAGTAIPDSGCFFLSGAERQNDKQQITATDSHGDQPVCLL